MDISKALLEKYERGLCNDQERAAVQSWLDSDSWDDFEDGDVKETAKEDIWLNLVNQIQEPQKTVSIQERVTHQPIHWSVYAAAACLLLFISFSYFFWPDTAQQVENFYADNDQTSLTWLHEQNFDVLLSENSSAHINLSTNSIALSGNIMFKPKRDFTLQDRRNNRVFHFKRNQTYVLSENPSEHKFIVLQKDELAFLPPPIQRKLKKQFQIS